jgi:hypothetical protein
MDVATTSCLSGVLRMVSVVMCGWMVVRHGGCVERNGCYGKYVTCSRNWD